jgi:hypothetical protein
VSLPLPCHRFEVRTRDETLEEVPATFEALL